MVAKLQMDMVVEKHLGIVNYHVEPNFIEEIFSGIELPFHYFIENHVHHVITISITYCVAIFSIQYFMQNRDAFNIRHLMIMWNVFLAIFSWMGAIRTIPELAHIIKHHGLHLAICHPNYFYGPVGFWTIMFCLSKPLELGDTLFIVLRKQKLIFLHWYHHVTVMIYCWYAFPTHHGGGRVFMVMNYLIHSIMYTYYTLRAFQLNLPRWINITITTLQLTQMLFGALINIYVFSLVNKTPDTYCTVSDRILYIGIFIYLSYMILFGNYFYHAYIKKQQKLPDLNHSNNIIRAHQNGCTKSIIDQKKEL